MRSTIAVSLLAAALVSGCSANKPATSAPSPSAQANAAQPAPAVANAPVPAPGKTWTIRLDDTQRAEVERVVSSTPPKARAHLRYALAMGDDGRRHLVVYVDPGDRAVSTKKFTTYVVFAVLNATNGEHYDPEQNAIVAPIPPPAEREDATKL